MLILKDIFRGEKLVNLGGGGAGKGVHQHLPLRPLTRSVMRCKKSTEKSIGWIDDALEPQKAKRRRMLVNLPPGARVGRFTNFRPAGREGGTTAVIC
jgi:hypothetical protein